MEFFLNSTVSKNILETNIVEKILESNTLLLVALSSLRGKWSFLQLTV
jgi:hypothetical protein